MSVSLVFILIRNEYSVPTASKIFTTLNLVGTELLLIYFFKLFFKGYSIIYLLNAFDNILPIVFSRNAL